MQFILGQFFIGILSTVKKSLPGPKALWDPSGAKPLLDPEVHFGALGVSSENLSSVSHGSEVLGQAIVMTDMRLEDSRRLLDGSWVKTVLRSGPDAGKCLCVRGEGFRLFKLVLAPKEVVLQLAAEYRTEVL